MTVPYLLSKVSLVCSRISDLKFVLIHSFFTMGCQRVLIKTLTLIIVSRLKWIYTFSNYRTSLLKDTLWFSKVLFCYKCYKQYVSYWGGRGKLLMKKHKHRKTNTKSPTTPPNCWEYKMLSTSKEALNVLLAIF